MFKKVLYPVDMEQTASCRKALGQVIEEIRHWNARLVLVYVMPGFGMSLVENYFPGGSRKAFLKKVGEDINGFIEKNVPEDVKVTPVVCEGTPYEQILRQAKRRKVDLIILPSQSRRGVERWQLGSTAAKVVRHAHCSVMVLRNC